MNYLLYLLIDAVLIIILLLLISAFARHEKVKTAYTVMTIDVILVIFFFILLFKYSPLLCLFLFFYAVIIFLLGKKNYYRLDVKELEFMHKSIKKEINLLYIADLQFDRKLNSYNERAFENLVEKINESNVDYLLMGGDYVNYEEHLPIYFKNLEKLIKGHKVISIFGNHDFLWKDKLKSKMDELGILFLENEYQKVDIDGEKILVIGLEDLWTGNPIYPQIKEEDLDLFKLVLIHNPDTMKKIEGNKFNIALAGHYHRGQVNLIPKVYVASIVSKYVYGIHEVGSNILYITSGIGGTFLRGFLSSYIRWNAPAEIVKITIKPFKEGKK